MTTLDRLKLPVVALQFLTRIPLAPSMEVRKEHLGQSIALFPYIGGLVALILAAIAICSREAGMPPGMAAAIVLSSEALITGAFHWDGLADTFDGFFSTHKTREEMLDIMHDSRVGVMGVVAVVCVALMQYAGLSIVLSWSYADMVGALITIHVMGKWSSVFLTTTAAYGRKDGKGMVFTEYATWKGLAIASLPLVAIAYVHPAYSIPAASVIAGAVMWGLYCNAKIGGVTGDTLGASIRLSETIALSAIVAMV